MLLPGDVAQCKCVMKILGVVGVLGVLTYYLWLFYVRQTHIPLAFDPDSQ
jgi:hypothetical protein